MAIVIADMHLPPGGIVTPYAVVGIDPTVKRHGHGVGVVILYFSLSVAVGSSR